MPKQIDSHCHLHFPAYEKDLDAVLLRMREQDTWAITVGTNVTTSQQGVAFAEQYPDVFATVGYHPEHLTSSYVPDDEPHETTPYDIASIAAIARSSKNVVAIGETGLDFFRIDDDRNKDAAKKQQEDAFIEHIALANELKLPVVIHCRNALTRLADVIRNHPTPGVVHCFTGNWEEAKPLLDLGLHLSFTGIITFAPKKVGEIHDVIQKMPANRMLIETDAPWLTPEPYRGKRNEPSYVQYVATRIAELRDTTVEAVAQHTTENATRLFRLHEIR